MRERDEIARQILNNCTISDARHAGYYSICGLALRLRDLYKWEHGLAPWVEKNTADISDWIGDKERIWDRIAENDFTKIMITGRAYDPFDADGINAVLEPEGLLYGAGYAYSLKPTFFLAVIEEKKRIDGHDIYMLGREVARDLFTSPALIQNEAILIRQDSARLFLWDKLLFIKKSGRKALKFALEIFGQNETHPDALRESLEQISASELDTYIYHELGEIKDTVFDRTIWQEIIAAFPHSPIELLVRAVKDLLADTGRYGTLRHIIQHKNAAALALYVAFLDGFLKLIFPDLPDAFRSFTETQEWAAIDQAVSRGHDTAAKHAETICRLYEEGKNGNGSDWTKKRLKIDC